MSFMKTIFGTASVLAISATAVLADPAIIYDMGGKFDKSFNESAYNGAARWAEESGGKYREFEISDEAQREQAIRRFAEEGFNPIVTTGFAMSSALGAVAADYPDLTFVTVDGWVPDAPNVLIVSFTEHEGSYLVGMMAGLKSESNTVGFIGGMDVPLIRKFACGYAQGVLAANPDATIISNMTGTTPSAWNDPVKGGELAKAQIAQGADIIYAAAGGTGVGVLQAAFDEGVLSIGVDSNQNPLHPGMVLTSMLKRVDTAVYNIMKMGDDAKGGYMTFDLADEGVDYAMDENNAALVSAEMKSAVDAAKAKIISGEIKVHDYTSDDSCSVLKF